MKADAIQRIVLGYSGGLDTSVAIRWLADQFDAEVVAVVLDLGQGRELTDVRRALALGAVRCHVIDVREEFAQAFILPALQAGAMYEDGYPLATALSRPLIARRLAQMARWKAQRHRARGCGQRQRPAAPRRVAPRRRPSMTCSRRRGSGT
jgi:argininosuccinate synthase